MAPKAQKKVPVPEGLDLDAWINEPPPEEESESEDDDIDDLATKNDVFGIKGRIFDKNGFKKGSKRFKRSLKVG